MPRRVRGAATGLRRHVRRRRRPRHDPAVPARPGRARPRGGRARAGRCSPRSSSRHARRSRLWSAQSDDALARTCRNAGLAPADVETLALLTAVELNPQRQRVVAYVQDSVQLPRPTLALLARLLGSGRAADGRARLAAARGRAGHGGRRRARGRSGCAAWCRGSCGRSSGSTRPTRTCPRAPASWPAQRRRSRAAGTSAAAAAGARRRRREPAPGRGRRARRPTGARDVGPAVGGGVGGGGPRGDRRRVRGAARGRRRARAARRRAHRGRDAPHLRALVARASCRWRRCRSDGGARCTSSTARPARRTGWPARAPPTRAAPA